MDFFCLFVCFLLFFVLLVNILCFLLLFDQRWCRCYMQPYSLFIHLYLCGRTVWTVPLWPGGKTRASRAADLGSIPAFRLALFPGQVIPVTETLALQWLLCQAPGVIGSAPGLVGQVSVYCDWVRKTHTESRNQTQVGWCCGGHLTARPAREEGCWWRGFSFWVSGGWSLSILKDVGSVAVSRLLFACLRLRLLHSQSTIPNRVEWFLIIEGGITETSLFSDGRFDFKWHEWL